ncbi:MAG: MATE family efflux transporter [Eubacterium sp.]|nr:MATE family efflux transporter [Eubacterium sp.]
MAKNMTEGNPLKLILTFSLPLLAGNLVQQTYNMVDAAIVGRMLGASALGAVGVSTSVQFMVLGFCIGICTGFAVPVAQAFGAGDQKHMRRIIWHGAVLAVLIGALLTLFCALFTGQILHLLKTPADIFEDAYRYLLVIFLGIPCTLLYNFLAGILRAVGDSRTPFFFLAFSAALNIILDLLCILVFRWDCAGAAIATVTAQGISGILCLLLIYRKFRNLIPVKNERRISWRMLGYIFGVGAPMGLQFSITAIGSMMMQTANNGLGSTYVSAFTAAAKLKQFTMGPFDAIATACATFAGQNYGAGKPERIKQGIRMGVAAGVLYGLAAGIILAFFGRKISLLFVAGSESAILDAAARYLKMLGIFFWLLGILNVLRLAVQGLGYSGRAIFSGVSEMIARALMSLFAVPVFGYAAICVTDQTAWIAAVAYIIPTYLYVMKKVREKIVMGDRE